MAKLLLWYVMERIICVPASMIIDLHEYFMDRVMDELGKANPGKVRIRIERGNIMDVNLRVLYSDGEAVEKAFDSLGECLDWVKREIVEKNEFADNIVISIH